MKVGDLVRLRNHANPNAWGVILAASTCPFNEQKFMVLWSPKFQRLHGKEKWLCASRSVEVLSESR